MVVTIRHHSQADLTVNGSTDDLASDAAQLFITLARNALATRGRFNVALSGGSTPLSMYSRLITFALSDATVWNHTHVFWSDERYVPANDPDNLSFAAESALLAHVPIPKDQIHPWPTMSVSPEGTAYLYADMMRETFKSARPRFDLILLGMGPDGHTASLFPGMRELARPSGDLTIAVYDAPKPPPMRISFTPKLINEAAAVIFLVAGSDKAQALRQVIEGPSDPVQWPAQAVDPVNGTLSWLVDSSAAKDLDQPKKLTKRWGFFFSSH